MNRTPQNVIKCAVVAVILCLALPAVADGHAQDEAAIRLAYQKMDQAVHDKDAAAFCAFAEPDYTEIDPSGKVTTHSKGEEIKKVGEDFAAFPQVTQHTTVRRIRFGTQGVTVETSQTNMVKATAKGKEILVQGNATARDLWVKSGGVWLMKTTKDLTDEMTTKVDGKVLPKR